MLHRLCLALVLFLLLTLSLGCDNGDGPLAPTSSTAPTACFTHTAPGSYISDQPIIFDASCSTDALFRIIAFIWDWDDGSEPETGSTATSIHTYTESGTYDVELTIRNEAGKTASTTQKIEILIPGEAPVACFTYEAPEGLHPGSEILFDASCSTESLFDIIEYIWDWDDGSEPENFGTATATHTYTEANSYDVELTINDEAGRGDSTAVTIEICIPGEAPIACFTYKAMEGWQPGSEFLFDASCSTDPDGDELIYTWDWGNGESSDPSDSPIISYSFSAEGIFEVTLTVSDSTGWESISEPVEISIGYPVGPPIVASLPLTDYAQDIVISGDYAYVADGDGGLKIINIQNPTNPQIIGSMPTDGEVRKVSVSGDYAAITEGSDRLRIVDIGNPASPVIIGTEILTCEIYETVINGNYVYVGAEYGLFVIDISNPEEPEFVKPVLWGFYIRNVALQGGYIYADVKGWSLPEPEGICIFDISDPADPVLISTIDPCGKASYDLLVSGAYMYAICEDRYLHVIDITDPENPVQIGDGITIFNISNIAISGDTIVTSSIGIDIIDASSPSWLEIIGSARTYGTPEAVAVTGNHVFAADGSEGLTVIDITDPQGPHSISFLPSDLFGGAVELHKNFAYIAAGSLGLRIVDLSDPYNPYIAGIAYTPGSSWDLEIDGDYAYLIDSEKGLLVFDISDPACPFIVKMVDTDAPYRISVSDGYACIAGYYYAPALTIVDIHDPLNPVVTATTDFSCYGHNIATSGDYVYIGSYYHSDYYDIQEINILDISDPTNPTLVDSFQTSKDPIDLGISGEYLCVLSTMIYGVQKRVLEIYDISNPGSPFLVNSIKTRDLGSGMCIDGNYAYIADREADLTIIDFTDPANLQIVGYAAARRQAAYVDVEGDLAFLLSTPNMSSSTTYSVIKLW